MIPWVREKFAERRAKWVASRKRNDGNTETTSSNNNSTINSNQRGGDEKQNTVSKLKSEVITINSDENTSRSPKENFRKMKILSPFGKMLLIRMQTTSKIIELKQEALGKFSEDSGSLPLFAPDIRQLYPRYRLVRPDSSEPLNENLTLSEIGVIENEMFILTIKRTNLINNAPEHFPGPTTDDIITATANVSITQNAQSRVDLNELVLQSDLQFDVRKVLISLAQSSAFVIGAGPYASRLISMLKQKLVNKRKHQNDTIQCLVDMGFTREKAIYSLKLNNGAYSPALDWLIEHENDPEILINDENNEVSPSSSEFTQSNNIAANIEALLEVVRNYSQREISPPPETVRALVDMGFKELDVLNALKMTRNNQAAACEWLCGNRSISLMELRDGLSTESPILKAMMESPQVQMSLSNPKIFIAYLSMLDNQNALSMWLGDSDTSSVLSHILRKYHEEKHILGINQFNSVR